ncbi:hypothetical protein [Paraburkholderia sp. UYCP14C]|nr:hypothetical protein [Paraburkholderia sp. UYCP14C]
MQQSIRAARATRSLPTLGSAAALRKVIPRDERRIVAQNNLNRDDRR